MKIVLEGSPRVGKTTVARRLVPLLTESGVAVSGFLTNEVRQAGRRVGFEIETIAGHRGLLAHVEFTGPPRVGRYGVDLATLERVALPTVDLTGHGQVRILIRDGGRGGPEGAPYDRIIVTVGPGICRLRGGTSSPGSASRGAAALAGPDPQRRLTRDGDRLRSEATDLCGFVPMIGQDGEQTSYIDPGGLVALYWDADQPIDPAALGGALTVSKTTAWSGATVGPYDPFDGVWLNLTATEPGTCRIAADRAALDSGLCTPAIPARSPALVEGDSLAYLTVRRLHNSADRRSELGAAGHGPTGPQLANRLCDQIRAWDRDRTRQPLITAHPAATPEEQLPGGLAIDKQHTRLVIS